MTRPLRAAEAVPVTHTPSSGDGAAKWWRLLVVWGGVEAVAVAVWLTSATVRIVEWTAAGPHRIALLPPVGRLAILVALAAVVAWVVGRRALRSDGVAARIAPLNLLWIWLVPFLPWLPDRLPLVLALDGPLQWVVAGLAAVLAGGTGTLTPLLEGRAPGRRAVILISLAVYTGFGVLSARAIGPGGDEPHYLVIAHSLLADGDLQIENNHQQRDYAAFFGGELRPDFLRRGQDGQIYSIHAPGLPAVLLPAYAVAGYLGAVVLHALLAALAALAIFDLADHLAGRRAAWLAWTAVCLTVPFIPHSWLLFPEMTAALVMAVAVRWLWMPPGSLPVRWAARGALVGLLPWMHTKFIVLLAALVLLCGIRLRRHLAAWLAFAGAAALSVAFWLYMFYAIYGVADPQAPYGHAATTDLRLANIPRGMLGLLLDQKFGLLFYSPAYLAAAAGCWIMLRRRETRGLVLALVVMAAAFAGSATRYYMWWGGSSAPARFLVPILPCLAPLVAIGLNAARAPVWRALAHGGIAVGVVLALGAAIWPDWLLVFSPPHGNARVLEWVQGGAPLASAWPTFTEGPWVGPAIALLPWVAAAILAVGVMTRACHAGLVTTSPGLTIAGGLTFLGAAAILTPSPPADKREETARRGRVELLWAIDESPPRGFDYASLAPIEGEHVIAPLSMTVEPPGRAVTLPAGSYQARVWLKGDVPRAGQIALRSSPHAVFARADSAPANPVVVPFELPVSAGRITVEPSGGIGPADMTRVEFVPRRIVPARERDSRTARAVEPIDGWPGAQIFYVDEWTYPEGGIFWTRATEPASILVVTAGASHLVLTLSLGPMNGTVRLSVGGDEHTVHVAAGQAVIFEAPLPDLPIVPVTIKAPSTFRPSDVDPETTDSRRLGCQVRVDLR